MIHKIPQVLDTRELKKVREQIAGAEFIDGQISAYGLARSVKHNEQLNRTKYSQILEELTTKLRKNTVLSHFTLAAKMYPPMINRYTDGMSYGSHVDAATMGDVRTDLSLTLFLSEPDEYDGGELIIETELGEIPIKFKAGEAVLYPSGRLHRVSPVTRGERLVLVTWIQSRVQDPAKRAIIQDLRQSIKDVKALGSSESNQALAVRLLKTQTNLEQMWTT